MKQITFKQYRTIDLSIIAVMLIIFEAVATLASARWFSGQPVALSITLIIACMAMLRWGVFAAIYPALGGLVFSIASAATPRQYLIYCLGNCLCLLSLLLFKLFGKDKITRSVPKLLVFVVSSYVLMQLGRWLISLFFGGDLMALLVYLTTDIISLLFAAVLMLLLRRMDGVVEDQKAYLFRLQREREAEAELPETDFSSYGEEDE